MTENHKRAAGDLLPADSGNSTEIIVRLIKPQLDGSIHKFWYANNPYLTHFVNSLSFVFPPGEETFVNSVNYFKDRVRDPRLRKDIKGFVSQEFNHSHLHWEMNQWVSLNNARASFYQKRLKKMIDVGFKLIKKFYPKFSLALTVGYEHLTAIMAAQLLSREDILDKMHGDIRNIFILHAIEEIEHKCVAFDVYKTIGGGYLLRVLSIIGASLFLIYMVSISTIGMLKSDKEHLNFQDAFYAIRETFGIKGYFTGIIPNYLRYFKPGFHPQDLQDSELLNVWRVRLAKSIEVRELGQRRQVNHDKSNLKEGVGA